VEKVGLKALLPVSGLSFVMSHGYDAQRVGVIEVDDGKWKAVKHEPSGSVQVFGPALGSLGNAVESIRDGNKSDTGIHTALKVPVVRRFNSCHACGSRR
jgi:hypothetical protein